MCADQTARVTPIFVIGGPRNGTTWLGNLLGSHPGVSCPQHVYHWGIKECPLHRMGKYAGDLSDDRRFIAFLEIFSSSDFFRLALGDKEYLYQRRPTSLFELYFDLMDRMAEQEGNRYWLCKLDPFILIDRRQWNDFIAALRQRYRSVRLLQIRREFRDVLRSYLRMEGQQSIHRLSYAMKHFALVVQTARQALLDSMMERMAQEHDVLRLEYSELREDMRAAAERVGHYIGLEDALNANRNPYRPNTSFTHDRDVTEPAGSAIWLASKPLYHVFRMLPFAARAVLSLRESRRPQHLPFYWRLLQVEMMPDGLSRELLRTGQVALHDRIFGAGQAGERPGRDPLEHVGLGSGGGLQAVIPLRSQDSG